MDATEKYAITYYPRIFPKNWKCTDYFNGYILTNKQYPAIVIQVGDNRINILNKVTGRSIERYNWIEDYSDVATNSKSFMRLFKSLKRKSNEH